MNRIIEIDKKVLAAAELYKHLYDLKDWHIEDESAHSYLKEMCEKGCIKDYLNIFRQTDKS